MNTSYRNPAGIDTSKANLDVHLLPAGIAKRFANTAAGHRELIEFLKSHQVDLVVIEATGGYEHAAVVAMVCAKLGVHVAQPQVIHAFARSLKQLAKTDPIDAYICARYAQDRGHELLIIDKIDANLEKIKILVNRRDELVSMRTMEKNRLQQASDVDAIDSLQDHLAYFDKVIERVEKRIDDTIAAAPDLNAKAKVLRTIQGVGPQTARAVIGLLPELGQVDDKRLNALVGVAPFARESGNSKGQRHIYGGRKLLRGCLYMACLTGITRNPRISARYKHLTQTNGKDHKSAMMDCIRVLLRYMDKLVRSLTQPVPPPASAA